MIGERMASAEKTLKLCKILYLLGLFAGIIAILLSVWYLFDLISIWYKNEYWMEHIDLFGYVTNPLFVNSWLPLFFIGLGMILVSLAGFFSSKKQLESLIK